MTWYMAFQNVHGACIKKRELVYFLSHRREVREPMTTYNVEFQPIGRRGQCQDSDSILDCAHNLHVGLTSTCGGAGTCGKCKIKIASGPVSEPTDSEFDVFTEHEIRDSWRLACQTYPLGDVKIHVPAESMTTPQRTQVEGYETQVTPEP